METTTDWKDEYRALVREMEAHERTWRHGEKLLRRAGSQIAIAALGQSELLDRSLESVIEALRGDLDPASLEDALEMLSDALRRLPRNANAEAADAEIALLMQELVRRLSEAPVFSEAAQPLLAGMDRALADNDWVALTSHLADTVGQAATVLDEQKAELEQFLEQVTAQLERIEGWQDWNRQADLSRREEGDELESTVTQEIQGIRTAVEEGDDVAQLKQRVQERLDSVAGRIRQFRSKEENRQADSETRMAALNSELNHLRKKTQYLSEVIEKKDELLLNDPLTGVRSRYAYEQRLEEEFHRWQRHGGKLSFSIWDIDRFKSVNDRLGHSAGDKLLALIAKLILAEKRHEDFIARIGGEEFVLLLPATDLQEARTVTDRIRSRVASTPFHYQGEPEQITISCGVTEFRDGDTPDTVFKRADAALYRAKSDGRNRCVAD